MTRTEDDTWTLMSNTNSNARATATTASLAGDQEAANTAANAIRQA